MLNVGRVKPGDYDKIIIVLSDGRRVPYKEAALMDNLKDYTVEWVREVEPEPVEPEPKSFKL